MEIKRIVVPVDYSEHAQATLEYAATLAERFGASIDVVHVWDRPSYVPDTAVIGKPGEPERSLADLIRENAEHEMTEFLKRTKLPPGVTVTHHLVSGEPASAVIKLLEHRDADLVILGTHGRAGVKHLLLGSVAEKLVRLSPIPVITVPPERAA